MADARIDDAIARARRIAAVVAERDDERLRQEIEDYPKRLRWRASRAEELGIHPDALKRIRAAGIRRRLVFAHPELLQDLPNASLYYRGIALLPRKRVQSIAGGVDGWERSPPTGRVTADKALKVARLYNTVISAIVLDRLDWADDDASRDVLANVGITADGGMRNVVGQQAEAAIKERMLGFVRDAGLVVDESDEGAGVLLQGRVTMRFGSEPDIGFERNGSWAVVIEIKGGRDPAGALERLGAIKKTFDETPNDCRNYLVAGVVTPTMRERLGEMSMERYFEIDDLLSRADAWEEFMNEVFHHGLRIAPEIGVGSMS